MYQTSRGRREYGTDDYSAEMHTVMESLPKSVHLKESKPFKALLARGAIF